MSRRIPPTSLLHVALALLLLAVVGGCGRSPDGKATLPDIVLIVWDTTRADRLSAYGYGRPTTPNLDAMARRGVRFADCVTPAPWTPPAHGSLFTGLPPRQHGLLLGRGDRLRVQFPTLATTLAARGYETVGLSANAHISPMNGLTRGFEHFVPAYARVPGGGKCDGDRMLLEVEQWLKDRAAKPVAGKRRPVFLFVNMMDAHLPLTPPAEALAAIGLSDEAIARADAARAVDQKAALGHALGIRPLDDATIAGIGDLYDAALFHQDAVTATLLRRLADAGIAATGAFVAITSDHGENLGERGLLEHRMSAYDTVLRVPMVLHHAGFHEGGVVVNRPVALQDLHPTILRAAGVVSEPTSVGAGAILTLKPEGRRTMIATFERPDTFVQDFSTTYFPEATPAQLAPFFVTVEALRDAPGAEARWKYIRRLRGRGAEVGLLIGEELYDLASDPGETRNLLKSEASPEARETANRLKGLLEEGAALYRVVR